MTKNKIQNRSFSIFHRSIMEGNWPALAYNGARTVYGKPVLRKFLNGLCKFRKHFTPICVTLLCAPPKLGCIISNFNPVFHGLVVMTFRTNFWRVWRFDTYFEMIQSFYIWVGGNPFFKKILPRSGVSSLGVPGVPWHPQILADQLTLSQPGGQILPT